MLHVSHSESPSSAASQSDTDISANNTPIVNLRP